MLDKYAYRGGRRVQPLNVYYPTVCDIIRRHMANHNCTHDALAEAWGVKRATVSTVLSRHKKRPVPAHYLAAVIKLFQLDEFDATELYRRAALEAGYLIDGPTLRSSKTKKD